MSFIAKARHAEALAIETVTAMSDEEVNKLADDLCIDTDDLSPPFLRHVVSERVALKVLGACVI